MSASSPPSAPPSTGNSRVRSERGFTLIELMVVMMVLGALLFLVPMNMDGWGAKSRLDEAANTIVAAVAAMRAQAIADGDSAFLEFGYLDEDGEKFPAFRYRFTETPAEKGQQPEGAEEEQPIRTDEREWITSRWRKLPSGVVWTGISERKGSWRKIEQGSRRNTEIEFLPSGDMAAAVAIRIESEHLEVKEEFRIRTVLLNALTGAGRWLEGKHELPEARDAREFDY